MQRVAGFHTLPQVYPSGQKRTAEDNKLYEPTTKDIMDGVTHELTLQDVEIKSQLENKINMHCNK